MNDIMEMLNKLSASELDSVLTRGKALLEQKKKEEAAQALLQKERERQEKIEQENKRLQEIAMLQEKLRNLREANEKLVEFIWKIREEMRL